MKSNRFVYFGWIVAAFFLNSCATLQAATAPTIWEYKVEPICKNRPAGEFVALYDKNFDEWFNYKGTCIAPEKVETRLNELGGEGWELVAIHSPLSGYGAGFPYSDNLTGHPFDMGRLVLKRPVK